MSVSSKRALSAAGLLAVILAIFVLLHLPGPSNQQQILSQLESARTAAQSHDVNGVMQIVSAQYQDSNGLNNDQLAFLLRRYAGGTAHVSVALSTPNVQVNGQTALSTSQLTVRDMTNNALLFDQPVTLRWKKEDGTKWLIFPAKVWRVVGADYTMPGGGGLF